MRASMKLWALGVLSAAGCGKDVPVRELPYPELMETGPFPELTEAKPTSKGGGRGPTSAFERAIAKARSSEGEGAAAQPDAPDHIVVGLAGTLVADIPNKFEQWRAAAEPHRTVITHQRDGEHPDAVVIIEPFQPTMRALPSQGLIQFREHVMPPRLLTTEETGHLAVEGIKTAVMAAIDPTAGLSALLSMAQSPTFGRGIGYTPTEGTDTGWRWVGRNHATVEVRMSRSEGTWGPQTGLGDALGATVREQLAAIPGLGNIPELTAIPGLDGVIPGLGAVADALTTPGGAGGTVVASLAGGNPMGAVASTAATIVSRATGVSVDPAALGPIPTRPAYLIIGNATKDQRTGVHFAILCARAPRCTVARELADFIGSIREAGPADKPTLPEGSGGGVLDGLSLAKAAGIDLSAPNPQLIGKLKQLMDHPASLVPAAVGGALEEERRRLEQRLKDGLLPDGADAIIDSLVPDGADLMNGRLPDPAALSNDALPGGAAQPARPAGEPGAPTPGGALPAEPAPAGPLPVPAPAPAPAPAAPNAPSASPRRGAAP
jgi:hypothetical protein